MSINKSTRRFVLSLFCLTLCVSGSDIAGAGEEYRHNCNELEGVRNVARLWVEYERLPVPGFSLPAYFQELGADPVPEVSLSPEEEAKSIKVWAEFGVACRNVEAAWTRALDGDPLSRRALTCYRRAHDLEWRYQLLRRDVRREYGNDKFREFDRAGAAWAQWNGRPWLDLDDTELVRLCVWMEALQHMRPKIQQDDILEGNIPTPTYQWMATTEPYADEIVDKNEELTEERAVEVCRAAIIRQREQTRDEHEKIAAGLDLPPNMWRYLKVRTEADIIYHVGGGYLGLHLAKYGDIRESEAELERLLAEVTAIRSDAWLACNVVYSKQVKEFAREHEAFEQSLRPQTPALK